MSVPLRLWFRCQIQTPGGCRGIPSLRIQEPSGDNSGAIDLLFVHACLAVKRWLTFKRILNASANGGRNLDKLNLTLFALRCRDSDDFVELAAEFADDIA